MARKRKISKTGTTYRTTASFDNEDALKQLARVFNTTNHPETLRRAVDACIVLSHAMKEDFHAESIHRLAGLVFTDNPAHELLRRLKIERITGQGPATPSPDGPSNP